MKMRPLSKRVITMDLNAEPACPAHLQPFRHERQSEVVFSDQTLQAYKPNPGLFSARFGITYGQLREMACGRTFPNATVIDSLKEAKGIDDFLWRFRDEYKDPTVVFLGSEFEDENAILYARALIFDGSEWGEGVIPLSGDKGVRFYTATGPRYVVAVYNPEA